MYIQDYCINAKKILTTCNVRIAYHIYTNHFLLHKKYICAIRTCIRETISVLFTDFVNFTTLLLL